MDNFSLSLTPRCYEKLKVHATEKQLILELILYKFKK